MCILIIIYTAFTAITSLPNGSHTPVGMATGDSDNDGDVNILEVDNYSVYRVQIPLCIETPCHAISRKIAFWTS